MYAAAAFHGAAAVVSIAGAVLAGAPLSVVGRVVLGVLGACFGVFAVVSLRWSVRSLELADDGLVLVSYLGTLEIRWNELRMTRREVSDDKSRLVLYGRHRVWPLAILTDRSERVLSLEAKLRGRADAAPR